MKKLFFLLLCFSFPVLAIECPPNKPMEYRGECYPCENGNNLFSEEECQKCPEFRKFESGLCTFTKSPYPDNPLFSIGSWEKICPKCRDCKCKSDKGIETNFVSCNYPVRVHTTSENCSICPNRFQSLTTSVPAHRITENIIDCFDCSEQISYQTTEENCAKCPNRKYENGYCFLISCPEGSFRLKGGTCWKCSALSNASVHNKEACELCSEREYKDGKCILKECPEGYIMDFMYLRDGCTPCEQINETMIKDVTEKECNKCPDREYSDGGCWKIEKLMALQELSQSFESNSCDTDWIFVNDHCERCVSSETFKVSESDCLKCNQYEELRVYDSQSGECKLKK